MLKWHKNYYRGASIKNISKIRLKLIQGKPVPGIYSAGSNTCSGNSSTYLS